MILVVGDCGGCQIMVFIFYFLFFIYGGGGWQWLAMDMAVIGVAWTEKKVVGFIRERERHSSKIKIILFK